MDNRVEILVGAQDNSRLDLDSLKTRLDAIGRKVETARIQLAGNKEAEVALERMALRLAGIGRKVASPRINLEGAARAEVDIAAIDLGMDRLSEKADRGGGILTRLGGAFTGLGTSMSAAVTNIPLIGGALGAIVPEGAAALPVLAAIAAAFVAIVIAMGPLVAGLGLITAGIGTFAAGAVGEIDKVIQAHQKLTAAQQAYAKATTASGRASALKAEQQATAGLTDSEKSLLGMMDQVGKQFGKLEKAIRPEVVKAFGTALDIIKRLMPALTPLAQAAGKALDSLLTNIDNWIQSPSGKKFLLWMESEGPRAIATFSKAVWDLIRVIGTVLYWWDRLGNDLITGSETWSSAVLHATANVIQAFKYMADSLMADWAIILHGAAKALGWVPGLGGKLKGAAASFDQFRQSVDDSFNKAINKVNDWSTTLANAPKIAKLQGDISDLTTKLNNAKAQLKDPNLTATRRAQIQANIAQLTSALAQARAQLARLNGATATTYVQTIFTSAGGNSSNNPFLHGRGGRAMGGIIGAASGMIGSDWTVVGEYGRELVKLPPGSHVMSNPDTERMMSGASGGAAKVVLEIQGGHSEFEQFMAKWIRNFVRVKGGGDVQAAFGWQM